VTGEVLVSASIAILEFEVPEGEISRTSHYTLRMAMRTRKRRHRQASMWVVTQELPRSAAHPFYRRLSRVLDDAQFDAFVEGACATFYAPVMGRPSLAPAVAARLP